jgi:hypothetical protein
LNTIQRIPIEGSQRLPKKPQPFLESDSPSKEAKLPLNQGQLTKQKLGKERARKNSKTNRKGKRTKGGTTTQPEDKTSPKLQGKLTTCYTKH